MLPFIPVLAIINRFRGAGGLAFDTAPSPDSKHFLTVPLSRYIAALLWGMLVAVELAHIAPGHLWRDLGANAGGFFLWSIWGWSLYFSAFQLTWAPKSDTVKIILGYRFTFTSGSLRWINKIGLWAYPFKTAGIDWSNGARGTLCFALRGLYIVPMFVYDGWRLHHTFLGLLCGISAAVMMGPIYRDCKVIANKLGGECLATAETFTGAVFGLYLKLLFIFGAMHVTFI